MLACRSLIYLQERRSSLQRLLWLSRVWPLFFAATAIAQQSAETSVKKERLAAANDLIDRLGGLPAEYKADIGLAILTREKGQLAGDREEQVSRAIFESAPRAHYSANVIYAAKSSDSSQSQISHNLYTVPVDTLDIQARIISSNLQQHLAFAVRSFESIQVPGERATCENANVDDVSAYYRTAAKLLVDPRVTQLRGQPKRTYIAQLAAGAREPERIVPFLGMIAQLPVDSYDISEIAIPVTKYFSENLASDREINALGLNLITSLMRLQSAWSAAQQPVKPLIENVRAYLVKSLSAEACSDATSNRKIIASRFNAMLTAPALHDVPPIDAQELVPRTRGLAAIDPQIPLDPKILAHLQHLTAAQQSRTAAALKPGTVADVAPSSEDVDAILNAGLEPTSSASQCPLCDYESRAVNFYMLVSALPAGQDRQKALISEVNFLSFNRIEEQDPAAFLSVLKALINVSRPVDSQTQEQLGGLSKMMKFISDGPSDEAPLIRTELERSRDRVIQAYVAFEKLYHPAYVLPPPLAARLAAVHKQ